MNQSEPLDPSRLPDNMDFAGRPFGRLTAMARDGENERGESLWLCLCECGAEVVETAYRLVLKHATACPACPRARRYGSPFDDLRGQKFGSLTALHYYGRENKKTVWWCRCDCPEAPEGVVYAMGLKNGGTQSCGHVMRQRASEANRTHGRSGTPEYVAWQNAIDRCCNPRNGGYKDYGGRGVSVCERWRYSFENFLADMGERPDGHSLDRIDPYGDYCPENCRWATRRTQSTNKRNMKRYEHGGRTLTIAEWAEVVGVSRTALLMRLKHGWPLERALTTLGPQPRGTTPVVYDSEEEAQKAKARRMLYMAVRTGRVKRPAHCQHPGCTNTQVQGHHHKGYSDEHALDVLWRCPKHHSREWSTIIKAFGREQTLPEWAEETGLKKNLIASRLRRGWTPERAVAIPPRGRTGGGPRGSRIR